MENDQPERDSDFQVTAKILGEILISVALVVCQFLSLEFLKPNQSNSKGES